LAGAISFGKTCPKTISIQRSFLGEVLAQYYATDYVPKEIHVPVDFEDRETIGAGPDRTAKGGALKFNIASAARKRDLIDLGEKNAKLAFEQRFAFSSRT